MNQTLMMKWRRTLQSLTKTYQKGKKGKPLTQVAALQLLPTSSPPLTMTTTQLLRL